VAIFAMADQNRLINGVKLPVSHVFVYNLLSRDENPAQRINLIILNPDRCSSAIQPVSARALSSGKAPESGLRLELTLDFTVSGYFYDRSLIINTRPRTILFFLKYCSSLWSYCDRL